MGSSSVQSRDNSSSHCRLGQYLVPTNSPILVLLQRVHRDPKIWGSDADEFKPERMMGEKFNALPRNAWKVGHLMNSSKHR